MTTVRMVCHRLHCPLLVTSYTLSEAAAEADGKLWTARGAVSCNRVDFLIVNGLTSKLLESMIETDYPQAIGVVELTTMGTRHDAITEATRLVNVEEYSVRFL